MKSQCMPKDWFITPLLHSRTTLKIGPLLHLQHLQHLRLGLIHSQNLQNRKIRPQGNSSSICNRCLPDCQSTTYSARHTAVQFRLRNRHNSHLIRVQRDGLVPKWDSDPNSGDATLEIWTWVRFVRSLPRHPLGHSRSGSPLFRKFFLFLLGNPSKTT